jgi:acyl-CoA synthetase (AMP-forming)/AMP-acid ligase II
MDTPGQVVGEQLEEDFLASYARERGEKPALISDKPDGSIRVVTFRELNDQTNRLANGMVESGVRPGNRVVWCGRSSIEVLVMQQAARKIGAVSVPLNHRLQREETTWILDNSAAVFVWTASEFSQLFIDVRPETPQIRHVVVFGGKAGAGQESAEDFLARQRDAEPEVEGATESGATIIYTSGTTGRPKGAVRSLISSPDQRQRLKDHLAMMHIGEGPDIYLPAGSMSHGGPLSFADLTVSQGNTVIVQERFDPEDWLRLLDKYRVTTSYSAPAPMRLICNLPAEAKAKYDRSSMRTMMAGAAPWPFSLKLAYLEDFPEESLWEIYGSTELGTNTILRPEDQRRKPGSCGQPAPGVEILLVDDDGKEISTPNTRGLLYVRGGSTFSAYHGDPEKYEAEHRGDAHTVGDVAYFDEEGFFYICDRKKDMIISGGVNIYPAEIESFLESLDNVLESAVIGLPDETWGERVHAVVVPKNPDLFSEQDVIDQCREHLGSYKVPRSLERVDELPHMVSGKIDKRMLRRQHLASHAGPEVGQREAVDVRD